MRVNVYAEELRPVNDKYGERVTRVEKQVVPTLPKKHQAIQILLGLMRKYHGVVLLFRAVNPRKRNGFRGLNENDPGELRARRSSPDRCV